MGFLYGNTSNHQQRTHFNFYRMYPNRKAMQHDVEDITAEDIVNETYVPYDSYLLVNYNFEDPEWKGSVAEDQFYVTNKRVDTAQYENGSFDLTVWQVQKVNELPRCVAIARLHSVLPTFEVTGQYRIDILEPISAGNYYGHGKYVMPLNADTDIATYAL